MRHALAVASGTGALTVALSALGVGPGHEVIVPAYMWVSVVAAVVNQGAIPVLADIDDTFCLDPHDVERKTTSRTTGIILVHMSGAPGNAKAIQRIAEERHVFFLEDCAQCNGGGIGGQKVGTFGDMGVFSFQMNKNMSSGEGGCLVTNDDQLYRRASSTGAGPIPSSRCRRHLAVPGVRENTEVVPIRRSAPSSNSPLGRENPCLEAATSRAKQIGGSGIRVRRAGKADGFRCRTAPPGFPRPGSAAPALLRS